MTEEELLKKLGRTKEQLVNEIESKVSIYVRALHHRVWFLGEKRRRYNYVLKRLEEATKILTVRAIHRIERVHQRIQRCIEMLSAEIPVAEPKRDHSKDDGSLSLTGITSTAFQEMLFGMFCSEKPEAESKGEHSNEVVTSEDRPFLAGTTGTAFQEMLEEEMVSAFGGPLEKDVLNELRVLESEIQMGHEADFEKNILKRLRELKKEVQKMKNCLERKIIKKGEHRDRRPDYAPYVAARIIKDMMDQRNREAQCRNEILPFGKIGFCGALLMHLLKYDAHSPTATDRLKCPAVNRFWTRCNWEDLRIVRTQTTKKVIPAPEGLTGDFYHIDVKVIENKGSSGGREETKK